MLGGRGKLEVLGEGVAVFFGFVVQFVNFMKSSAHGQVIRTQMKHENKTRQNKQNKNKNNITCKQRKFVIRKQDFFNLHIF